MNKALEWYFNIVYYNHGRIKWQHVLLDLKKALDFAYRDVLNNFDSTWGVKGRSVKVFNLQLSRG